MSAKAKKNQIITSLSADEEIPDRFIPLSLIRRGLVEASKMEFNLPTRIYFKLIGIDFPKLIEFIDQINSKLPKDTYLRISEDINEVLIGKRKDPGSRKIINLKNLSNLITPLIIEKNKFKLKTEHMTLNQKMLNFNSNSEMTIKIKLLYILFHDDSFTVIDKAQTKSTKWLVESVADSIFTKK